MHELLAIFVNPRGMGSVWIFRGPQEILCAFPKCDPITLYIGVDHVASRRDPGRPRRALQAAQGQFRVSIRPTTRLFFGCGAAGAVGLLATGFDLYHRLEEYVWIGIHEFQSLYSNPTVLGSMPEGPHRALREERVQDYGKAFHVGTTFLIAP